MLCLPEAVLWQTPVCIEPIFPYEALISSLPIPDCHSLNQGTDLQTHNRIRQLEMQAALAVPSQKLRLSLRSPVSAVKPSSLGCQTSSAVIPSRGQVHACIGTPLRLKVVHVIQSADGITQLHVNMPSLHIWEITSARGVLGQSPVITLDSGKFNVL